MSVTVRKGKIGVGDINFYSSASPTFSRTTSTGGSTVVTALSATHIPLVQGAASLYWSANNLQRATTETVSRYIAPHIAMSTYGAGLGVGQVKTAFGYRNALAATSIQAAASNMFLSLGYAAVVVPAGTYTVSTPIALPRNTILVGNGRKTVFRASSTIQTSRVFTTAGSSGATSQALGSAVNAGATQLAVSNGAQFTASGWIAIQSSTKNEMHQVRSVAGNNLNLFSRTRARFATGTVKVIYPSQLNLDNFEIQLSSATQGIGVAGTYVTHSVFGKDLRIVGAAQAGVKLTRSDNNTLDMQILNPKSLAAGMGYGVWLTGGSGDNKVGGIRQYVKADVADQSSNWNRIWGVQRQGYRGASMASGINDPISIWYRLRKPELGYAAYGATTLVTCPAGTNNPAEVYIDGNVYKNTGTVLCDLSRTITPANATVGGLDRGPATATRVYYLYAVPTQNPSATRGFDVIASSQSAATGPLASATFPQWSYLGAVTTAATVRLRRFVHQGDRFMFENYNYLSDASLAAAQATWKSLTSNMIPVDTKHLTLNVQMIQPAVQAITGGYQVVLGNNDSTNINHFSYTLNLSGNVDGSSKGYVNGQAEIPIISQRFKYRNNFPVGGGTLNLDFYFCGYAVDRSGYK